MTSDPKPQQSDSSATHPQPSPPTPSQPSPPSIPAEASSVLLPNERNDLESVRDELINLVRQAGYNETSCFAIRLAFEESVSNAFKHGCCNAQKYAASIEYHVTQEMVFMRVTDFGDGFDVKSVPDPTLDSNLSNPAGRGLMLIKAYMSNVYFNDKGNSITLIYKCPGNKVQTLPTP